MMAASGQRRAEVALCHEACQRSPRAYWAWRRVGFLEAAAGRWQEALVSLQHALRGDARDAEAWEALALAYQRLGKFTAALKAYGQAEKLEKAEGKVPVFTLLQVTAAPLEAQKRVCAFIRLSLFQEGSCLACPRISIWSPLLLPSGGGHSHPAHIGRTCYPFSF
jgi:tetratricopeptide (TPR) repeat protein